jgi:hypothetical protein
MKNLFLVVVAVCVLGFGYWYTYFGPYYYDQWKMTDIAGTAALSWAAYSRERGESELRLEMRRRTIGEEVIPEDCEFYEDVGNKIVECLWQVEVTAPGLGTRRLKLRAAAAASPDHRLVNP